MKTPLFIDLITGRKIYSVQEFKENQEFRKTIPDQVAAFKARFDNPNDPLIESKFACESVKTANPGHN